MPMMMPPGMPQPGMPPGGMPPGMSPQGPPGMPMPQPPGGPATGGPLGQMATMPGMGMAGGGSPPGSPQGGPDDIAQQLAAIAMQMIQNPATAQGMAFRHILDAIPKLFKAERAVPAMAPKMTATTPFTAPIGRADQSALGQMQGAQSAGMPPGGGPGASQMLAALAAARGGQ